MLRNFYLVASLLIISCVSAFAQTGTIKGRVLDKTTNEPLPFANVIVELNGTQAGGAQTDFDGNFTIKPLNPGTYDLKASFVGYTGAEVKGVIVSAEKITFQDIKLPKGSVDITQIDITEYKVPLIDKGNPSTQNTITYEQIQAAPTRDVRAVAATTAGVFQKDEGDALNIRGSRDNATSYYIDGIKVRGSTRLPQSGVEQITVVTGGVPAQYGDNTGGVIAISTRGPSKDYTGGVEFVTSELFDQYGYNLAAMNLSGPLYSKKESDGTKSPIVDFFISGEFQRERDQDPAAVPMYRVKEDKYNEIVDHPLTVSPLGQGYVQSAAYLHNDDLEKVKAKPNNDRNAFSFDGKIQFALAKNLLLSVGGSGSLETRHAYSDVASGLNYELLNPDGLPKVTDNTWRAYARITQKFGRNVDSKEKSASIIKNAYYTLQADYTRRVIVFESDMHGDDLFKYGWLGQFKQYRGLTDDQYRDTVFNGVSYIYQLANPADTLYTYVPGGANPILENYTIQYYNDLGAGNANGEYGLGGTNGAGNYQNFSQIQANGGLVNGQNGNPVYSIWQSPGTIFNLYRKTNETSFRISGMASADVKNHAITFGVEYDQREDRNYGVNPVGLWTLMRQLGNNHYVFDDSGLDTNALSGNSGDTIFFAPSYNGDPTNPGFYENIRTKLNKQNNEYVDIGSYDPSNFDLDLFTADELLNQGNALVGYYGYDYKGEVLKDNPAFRDFWTAVDENGNKTRPIGSFRPIYMAGYVQDKFAINDLIFNVGVRIDRFDANQQVLKDPYSLFATRTAGEVAPNAPSNIGDDYVVYVSDKNAPDASNIVGYRNGDDWYDAQGNQVSDPGLISGGASIAPWLVNPNLSQNGIQSDDFDPDQSFKDYDPQINIMPRIAFSFPISDEALFFAHYDILTQRPPNRLRSNPTDYYFIENNQGNVLNNPALKPERTTDYELGFKQAISKSSSISISAFYRELKNLIQQKQMIGAFPVTYITYANFDFGTVKGLTLSYDLRRTQNTRLTATYTLQFADGTGSNDGTSNRLIQNELGNLVSIEPLDFDQRHAVNITFDFRYAQGKDYNGPVIGKTQILSNMGLNVNLKTGSGTPYSAEANITNQAGNIGLQQVSSSVLDGSVNGSRLPWQFRIDAKLDKDINLKFGKNENKRTATLNIYIMAQNLLNRKNVINVYKATGVPDDDGYLSAAQFQNNINSQTDPQSYRDLYSTRVNNPDNYSIPRRIRLGVRLDF